MKIAFLIERLDRARGGAETYVADFAGKLVAMGHDVHVFARAGGSAPEGVGLHEVPVRGIGRGMRTLSFARNVERALRGESFDVVQGVSKTWSQDVYQPHGGVHLATLAANERMKRGPSRLIHRIGRHVGPKQRAFRRIERRQYIDDPPKVFVALSRMVKRDMMDFYGVAEEEIALVYNGVDTERFHPQHRKMHRQALRLQFGIGDDELVFLIVAHNFPLKGVPELVDVVTRRLDPCRLLVVGGGKAGGLKERAEARAPGRVIFAGPQPDTVPFYAAADVYVQPTWYDPCSLVVLEGFASGLPVITSMMNGAGELMTPGKEGFIVEPGDEDALAEAMSQCFDAEGRQSMGEAARALAETHTIDHNYREMLAVYERVMRH